MKAFLMVLLFGCWPAMAENIVPVPPPNKEELSVRDQIKASRAKERADEATKERPWDRDARGRRPWDQDRDDQK